MTSKATRPAGPARYLQDNQGAFETAACGGGRAGMCLRQSSPQAPITWKTLADPSTYGGNLNWNNYSVSGDVMLEKSGYVQMEGRVGSQNLDPVSAQNGYFLRVTDAGAWSILRNSTNGQLTTLRSGTVAALGTNRWHSLALGFSGSSITAAIDGTTVGTASDSAYGTGQVGFGTSQGETAQFDNLSVVPGAGSGTGLALRNLNAGRCLDVPGAVRTNGTQLALWDCNGGANQQWTVNADNTVTNVQSGLCLDASGAGTANSTPVIVWACNNGNNQKWTRN